MPTVTSHNSCLIPNLQPSHSPQLTPSHPHHADLISPRPENIQFYFTVTSFSQVPSHSSFMSRVNANKIIRYKLIFPKNHGTRKYSSPDHDSGTPTVQAFKGSAHICSSFIMPVHVTCIHKFEPEMQAFREFKQFSTHTMLNCAREL